MVVVNMPLKNVPDSLDRAILIICLPKKSQQSSLMIEGCASADDML